MDFTSAAELLAVVGHTHAHLDFTSATELLTVGGRTHAHLIFTQSGPARPSSRRALAQPPQHNDRPLVKLRTQESFTSPGGCRRPMMLPQPSSELDGRRRPVVMIAHLKPSPKFELPEIL
jgi:hypothetical protein